MLTIKPGHKPDPGHSIHPAMVYMAEQVAKKSPARMRIDVHPSQQLGTEREAVELLRIGSLGMIKVSTSVVEPFAPSYKDLGPHLF